MAGVSISNLVGEKLNSTIGRHAQGRILRCMICGKSRVAHKQSHPASQTVDQRGTRRQRELIIMPEERSARAISVWAAVELSRT